MEKTAGEALRGTVIVDYLKLLDVIDGDLDVDSVVKAIFQEFENQGVTEEQIRVIVGKLERFVRYKQRLQFPADAKSVNTWAEVRERLAKSAQSTAQKDKSSALVDQMDEVLRQQALNREIEHFEKTEQAAQLEKQAK